MVVVSVTLAAAMRGGRVLAVGAAVRMLVLVRRQQRRRCMHVNLVRRGRCRHRQWRHWWHHVGWRHGSLGEWLWLRVRGGSLGHARRCDAMEIENRFGFAAGNWKTKLQSSTLATISSPIKMAAFLSRLTDPWLNLAVEDWCVQRCAK